MRNQYPIRRAFEKIGNGLLIALSCGSFLALAPGLSSAGTVNLAQEPLFGATTTSVYPNLMFVLDTSGSMGQDYVPDYLTTYTGTTGGFPSCFDQGSSLVDARQNCYIGDPPFMSPDFNLISYNPDFTYEPGANGSSTTVPPPRLPTQSITNVTLDPYDQQKNTQLTNGDTGSTVNLTGATAGQGYPDRRWCALSTQDISATGAWSWVQVFKTTTASTTISQLNVGALNVLSGTTTASTTASGVAANIVAKVTAAGYSTNYTAGASGFWLIAPTGTIGTPTYTVATGAATLTTSPLDAACVANTTGYVYPNEYRRFLPSSGGTTAAGRSDSVPTATGRYALGAPYYWRIISREYCTTEARTTCIPWTSASANAIQGATTYSTNMYCADPGRSFATCQATEDTSHRYPAKCTGSTCLEPGLGSAYPYAAGVRFCKAPAKAQTDPLVACQGTYNDDTGNIIPEFLGYVIPAAGDVAYGTITVPSGLVAGQSITGITIDGNASNLLTGTYTVQYGQTDAQVASGIAALINSSYKLDGIRAITKGSSANVITVASAVVGVLDNGKTFTVTGPTGSSPGTKATATLTVSDGPSGSSDYRLGPICVGTVSGTYPSEVCSGTTISSDTAVVAVDLSTAEGKNLAATAVANAINNFGAQGYVAAVVTPGDNTVTITAPAAGTFTSPINIMTVTGGGASATGLIAPYGPTAGTLAYRIDAIKVGTTTISGPVTGDWDLSTQGGRDSAANAIASAITNGYSGTIQTPGTVKVTADTPGTGGNGLLTVESAGSGATGSIKVSTPGSDIGKRKYRINSITVATIPTPTTIATNIEFSANLYSLSGRQSAATAIKNAIGNGYTGSCTGGASCTGDTVTITANTPGAASNGTLSIAAAPAVAPTDITLTIGDAGTSTVNTDVDGIWMTGCLDSALNRPSGKGILNNDPTSTNSTSTMATRIQSAGLVSNSGFSLITKSGSVVTLTPNQGSRLDGCTLSVYIDGTGGDLTFTWGRTPHFTGLLDTLATTKTDVTGGAEIVSSTVSGMTGGTSAVLLPNTRNAFSGGTQGSGTIAVVTQPFSGGSLAGIERRAEVGSFTRCDITSTANCHGLGAGKFYRSPNRTDCAATGYCTYAEESTNFANWYAYYRTRLQAMKTGVGLAFSGIGSTYRIGFATLQSTSTGASSFLRAADFADGSPGQKQNWYTKLYAQPPANSTPLRGALKRIGQMYAHKGDLAAGDPVQYSCQQNFVLLTTDGYWNTDACSAVTQLDNSTQIGQQDGAPAVSQTTVDAVMWDGDQGGVCRDGGDSSTSSSVGTLADVAYYYAHTDLRPENPLNLTTDGPLGNCFNGVLGTAQNVCKNNVPRANSSEPAYQHMNTFTLGLGVSGTLRFQNDYASATSGDFYDIKTKVKKWPKVTPGEQTTVDDLWHAGVNGFGKYFSASNPAMLKRNLDDALSAIKSSLGTGAAAATSAQALTTQTQNFAYVASYQTGQWTGNLEARPIDATTAEVDVSATWCISDIQADSNTGIQACSGKLKTQVDAASDSRTIKIFNSAAANKLVDFNYANLTSAGLSNYFNPCSPSAPVTALSQCTLLSAPTLAATDSTALVNYLRGHYGQEMDRTANASPSFRNRKNIFGDAVGSQPVFLGSPSGIYNDLHYGAFKTAIATQHAGSGGFPKTVFIGANDGMMHAFNAADGTERWAYIPGPMLTKLRILADDSYDQANQHRYFVNASPTVAEVCFQPCTAASDWHTILVGAYGAGGKGYFALDVTDPTTPKGLWEFGVTQDADVGYSFGNPIITKLKDGRWVVLVTAGYENTTGSGEGVLFALRPDTGEVLLKISNNSGTAGSPSGLAKIEAYITDAAHDNTANDIYGGDLNGNVWRFRLQDADAANPATLPAPQPATVVKIAQLAGSDGTPQPITVKPVLTVLDDAAQTRYVVVATGQLLQTSDMSNTKLQTIYAFAENYDVTCPTDNSAGTLCEVAPKGTVFESTSGTTSGSSSEVPSTYSTVGHCAGTSGTTPPLPGGCPTGARGQLLGTTLVSDGQDSQGRALRKTSSTTIPSTKTPLIQGCYVNLPDAGERVNIDPLILNGKIVVVTNVPEASACSTGGHSFLNVFDYKTCNSVMSVELGSALAVGLTVVETETGELMPLVTMADNPTPETGKPVPQTSPGFGGRRVGWRLLTD